MKPSPSSNPNADNRSCSTPFLADRYRITEYENSPAA
jgi:hypothetical protein